MIIDARSLPENKPIDTDVCIVGAGTAGIVLARELIDQKFRVCLLESGGLKPDQQTQSLSWGENVGHPYFQLDTDFARYFGGTSNRWFISIGDNSFGARMRPLDEIDFEKRDWVPYSGWPFDKSHLVPYYERAEKICKIESPTYEVKYWEDPVKTPRLPLNDDIVETVIFKFGSRTPFIDDYSQEVIQANNITTYLYANAVEIETDDIARTVTRLRVACLQGNKFWVSAKLFILAAGAIEIPRLLLLSNKIQSNGLGNQYDLVGRFFMEHPHSGLGFYIPTAQDNFRSTALYSNIHKVQGVPVLGKLALSEGVLRREKLLNFVTELVPNITLSSLLGYALYPTIDSESVRSFKKFTSALIHGKLPEDITKHMMNVIKGVDDITVSIYRKIKIEILKALSRRRQIFFLLGNMSEQAPNPMSRVTLSPERDKLGQNRVRLDWRLSSFDIQSIIRSQEIIAEEVSRKGLGLLYVELNDKTPPQRITGGWHPMGTTRMHVDPKEGVVNENCQVHGISNLFIAGPSVFPTCGYANPALTIVALAVRLADHVKKVMS